MTTIRMRTHDVVRGINTADSDELVEMINDIIGPLDPGDASYLKVFLAKYRGRGAQFRDERRSAGVEVGLRAAAEARASAEAIQALQRANRRVWP